MILIGEIANKTEETKDNLNNELEHDKNEDVKPSLNDDNKEHIEIVDQNINEENKQEKDIETKKTSEETKNELINKENNIRDKEFEENKNINEEEVKVSNN